MLVHSSVTAIASNSWHSCGDRLQFGGREDLPGRVVRRVQQHQPGRAREGVPEFVRVEAVPLSWSGRSVTVFGVAWARAMPAAYES
jgi:hypothetical protein